MTPLNVLVVGEDDILRQTLPLLLPGRVALVDRSTDPEHVRRLLARRWPHIVLLDLDRPQAQALRPQLRGVPLILLAADPPAPDTAGAFAALRKPVAPDELRRAIEA